MFLKPCPHLHEAPHEGSQDEVFVLVWMCFRSEEIASHSAQKTPPGLFHAAPCVDVDTTYDY